MASALAMNVQALKAAFFGTTFKLEAEQIYIIN